MMIIIIIILVVDWQGYRLEPLVLKHYATIRPLPIHYFNSSRRPNYTQMPRKAYAAFKGSSDELAQKQKAEESQDSNGKEDDSTENPAMSSAVDKTENKSNGAAKRFSLCE